MLAKWGICAGQLTIWGLGCCCAAQNAASGANRGAGTRWPWGGGGGRKDSMSCMRTSKPKQRRKIGRRPRSSCLRMHGGPPATRSLERNSSARWLGPAFRIADSPRGRCCHAGSGSAPPTKLLDSKIQKEGAVPERTTVNLGTETATAIYMYNTRNTGIKLIVRVPLGIYRT
eukprot:SAG31_NODE_2316_length_5951_cov_7.632262_4_plen_172_part_00